jgi:hypothetical protein
MTTELEQMQNNEIPESVESNESIDAPIAEKSQDNEQRLYNSKEVSAIVKREREKAIEKARREAAMEIQEQQQQAQQAQAPAQAMQQAQGQTGLGGMNNMSPEQVQAMIQQQLPQMMEQHVNQIKQEQVVNSFVKKMQAAEEHHPGLETELNQLNWKDSRTSALAMMANDLENTGDIMRELLDHPSKFGELLNLVDSQPHLAAKQLFSLSNSIKQNQKAQAENKRAQEPLSQLKPSLNAGMDNGSASVTDFRKMQW